MDSPRETNEGQSWSAFSFKGLLSVDDLPVVQSGARCTEQLQNRVAEENSKEGTVACTEQLREHSVTDAGHVKWTETDVKEDKTSCINNEPDETIALPIDPDSIKSKRDVCPQQPITPPGTRSAVIKRGGTHLEVDIPASGILSESKAFLLVIFTVSYVALTALWTSLILAYSISASIQLWTLSVFTLPFWVSGVWMTVTLLRSCFIRKRLTISPSEFHIRSTLQFKLKPEDSILRPEIEPRVRCLDRVLGSQVNGKTSDLTEAEVQIWTDVSNRPRRTLVLWEETKDHDLDNCLTDEEQEWLLSEINAVLEIIRQDRNVP